MFFQLFLFFPPLSFCSSPFFSFLHQSFFLSSSVVGAFSVTHRFINRRLTQTSSSSFLFFVFPVLFQTSPSIISPSPPPVRDEWACNGRVIGGEACQFQPGGRRELEGGRVCFSHISDPVAVNNNPRRPGGSGSLTVTGVTAGGSRGNVEG